VRLYYNTFVKKTFDKKPIVLYKTDRGIIYLNALLYKMSNNLKEVNIMKIRVLSIILLIGLLLTACQSSGVTAGISYNGLPAITPELKQEIETVFSKEGMEEFDWEEVEHEGTLLMETIGYYGTYDGYSIFYARYGVGATVVNYVYIDDVLLDYDGGGGAVRFFAYKEGTLNRLNEAYEKGYVTIETVQTVADLRGQRLIDNSQKRVQLHNEKYPEAPMEWSPGALEPFLKDK
jgi:hypothetical protein